jgi:hypothetical protein
MVKETRKRSNASRSKRSQDAIGLMMVETSHRMLAWTNAASKGSLHEEHRAQKAQQHEDSLKRRA